MESGNATLSVNIVLIFTIKKIKIYILIIINRIKISNNSIFFFFFSKSGFCLFYLINNVIENQSLEMNKNASLNNTYQSFFDPTCGINIILISHSVNGLRAFSPKKKKKIPRLSILAAIQSYRRVYRFACLLLNRIVLFE